MDTLVIMCKVGVLFLSCIVVCTWSFSSLPPGASCSSDEAELAGKRLQTLVALDSLYKSFSAYGSPNYDPDGQLKCSDDEECPAQTDFVLGEPTGEFLASMTAYDVAIADAYNDPLTNFSLDHYKFPQVVPTAM